jgi:hypothetical protein
MALSATPFPSRGDVLSVIKSTAGRTGKHGSQLIGAKDRLPPPS